MGALSPLPLSLLLLTATTAGASGVPPQPPSGGAPPSRCLATEGFLFPGRAFPLNQAAYAVVSGDFNRDGKPDLAVSLAGSPGSVAILLGEGAGGFRRGASYPVQDWPMDLATADLNGDGKLDVSVASSANARPEVPSQVLLGKGDGTFAPPRNLAVGGAAKAVTVADFDGDGRPDLAFALDSGSIALLSGRGDGTFAPAELHPAGARPTGLATADLNGDKRPDLAMVDDDALTVLLNQGGGEWGRVRFPAAGARRLAVGDWDGDGTMDLAVAKGGTYGRPSGLSILINPGDGSFPSKMDFRLSQTVWALTPADLDGDGRTNLIASLGGDDATPGKSSGDLAVFRNLGHGLFAEPRLSGTGALAIALTVGTFDGTRRPGLAAVGPAGLIFLVRNEGGGQLEGQTRVALPRNQTTLWTGTPGDFNGDGHADVATVSSWGNLALFLGRGDGSFQGAVQKLPGPWMWLGQSQLNGDPFLDLVLVGPHGIEVLLGRGNGTFAPSKPVLEAGRPTPGLAALVDLQGDGRKDLAVIDSPQDSTGEEATLRVFLGHGDGTFAPPRIQKLGKAPTAMAAVDLDGAGHHALVMTDTLEGDLTLLARWTDGALAMAPVLRQQRRSWALAAGDVNGDRRADLLTFPADPADAQLLLGDGQGHFSPGPLLPVSSLPRPPSFADMDGDGQLDLVGPGEDGTWMFVRGLGGGRFSPPQVFATGAGVPRLLALADFDHSGRLSAALSTGYGSNLEVLAPARCPTGGPQR